MNLDQFQRLLRRTVLFPAGALLFLVALLGLQLNGTLRALASIERTDRLIVDTQALLRLIVDQETGLRGYQITEDSRFLQPFQQAQQPIDALFSELPARIEDPVLARQVLELHASYEEWLRDFAQPIATSVFSPERYSEDPLNLTGKLRMDHIRSLSDDMLRREDDLSMQRSAGARAQVRSTVLVTVVFALIIGVILSLQTYDSLSLVSKTYQHSLDDLRGERDQLFQSREKLQTTLNSIGDGVITCDAEGCVDLMNPVAQELCGWSQEEAFGKPLEAVFNIVNEDTRKTVENPVAKVKRLNRIVGLANHTTLISRDGTERNIDDSGAPIRNEHGVLIGIVLVFRDITQQRKSEAALLATQKLAIAGRLSATIAHEIHNPLDSISNLLYLLQQEPHDDEAGRYLNLAQQEVARVPQISRSMLSLYRESKSPVSVEMKELLEGILLLIEPRLAARRITAFRDLPVPITVQGFPAELRQVFTNLITNAKQAAQVGGCIRISLSPGLASPPTSERSLETGAREEAIQGAVVEIRDDGLGIPPNVLSRLFQPFFTTKGEDGTGLGLWVSRGIIQKHGGTITIESRTEGEEHGTTVCVFLPAKIIGEGRYAAQGEIG